MNDNDLLKLLEKTDGPVLRHPPPPKPYYSCRDCKYFETTRASTGGVKGAPTYFKYCGHSSFEFPIPLHYINFHGTPLNEEITPHWCPELPKDVDKSQIRFDNNPVINNFNGDKVDDK